MDNMTVKAKRENLTEVISFLNTCLDKINREVSFSVRTHLEMAIEEIFTNVSDYAYSSDDGLISVAFVFKNERNFVVIKIIDSGLKFDPLERSDPDITLPAHERNIGGLGIFMAKKFTDNIEYSYEDGKNVLTMTKRLT